MMHTAMAEDGVKGSTSSALLDLRIGAGQLLNAHQNPRSAYYYGPPQAYTTPPVIVNGPSNDMRTMYAQQQQNNISVMQQSFSDSYNEAYFDQRRGDRSEGGTAVIYEESQIRDEDQEEEDLEEEEDYSSEPERSDDRGSPEEDDSDEEEESEDTELMQYNESAEESADDNEHAHPQSKSLEIDLVRQPPITAGDATRESEDNRKDAQGQQEPPPNARSKSLPSTPVISAPNGNAKQDGMASTPEPHRPNVSIVETPQGPSVKTDDLSPLKLNGDLNQAKTPKGDKSTAGALTQNTSTKKRSLSQDNADPTSPPLMPQLAPITDLDGDAKKKKSKNLKRKKKDKEKDKESKRSKKKSKKRPALDNEVTLKSEKKGVFKRKKLQKQKHLETLQNMQNNLYSPLLTDDALKPVISSNVHEYTTQHLSPPNYAKQQHQAHHAEHSHSHMNGGKLPLHQMAAPNSQHQQQQQQQQQQYHVPYPTPQRAPNSMHYLQYQRSAAQRQRMEMQQHIASSDHLLVNPYRQFSVAFNERPFHIKLQYRNGFNAFHTPSVSNIQQTQTLTRPEYIWGWYSVEKHAHIPVGSKLISINFEWIYDKNQSQIAELMYKSPLPTTLIFEAPSYLNRIPPSMFIELHDEQKRDAEEDEDDEVVEDKHSMDKASSFDLKGYLETKKSFIFWWLEDGGFVVLCLALLALLVLDIPWSLQFYYSSPVLLAIATVFLMSVPPQDLYNLVANLLHVFLFKVHRRRGSGLTLFGHRVLHGKRTKRASSGSTSNPHVSITNDRHHQLLIANVGDPAKMTSSRRSVPTSSVDLAADDELSHNHKRNESPRFRKRNKRKKNSQKKRDNEEEKKYSEDHELILDATKMDEFLNETVEMMKEEELLDTAGRDGDEKEDKESEHEHDDDDVKDGTISIVREEDEVQIDPDWETNICHPDGATEVWGAYSPCSSKTLKLRGAGYLTDKIKICSEESLLSLANMDIFTVHNRIHHMAQNEVSWFYRNRRKLPRNLFFIIVHLRLDSMTASVVQYFYIEKSKFAHLLQSNEKCAAMAAEKGDGYFAIGGRGFDESGMFWNFINGPCKFRNDRLKLLARKEEGPWYMQIPTRPAILGKQIPIEYYRGYNANHLNSLKVHNTRSEAYEPYEFQTLYHDPNKREPGDVENKADIPCQCGKCRWINTHGEYPEYLEIDVTPEVNSVAKSTIRIACPLAKSLQVEMHWTMEGQNSVELPERMLCSARLIHVDLTKLVELD